MIISLEDPSDEDLSMSVSEEINVSAVSLYELTMPRENRAPRPRTTPYPHPTLRGGAIGILLNAYLSRKASRLVVS